MHGEDRVLHFVTPRNASMRRRPVRAICRAICIRKETRNGRQVDPISFVPQPVGPTKMVRPESSASIERRLCLARRKARGSTDCPLPAEGREVRNCGGFASSTTRTSAAGRFAQPERVAGRVGFAERPTRLTGAELMLATKSGSLSTRSETDFREQRQISATTTIAPDSSARPGRSS